MDQKKISSIKLSSFENFTTYCRQFFDLRYEDGKMSNSNNFRVFIILKGANAVGNELDNAQSEYGATLSPALFFLLR